MKNKILLIPVFLTSCLFSNAQTYTDYDTDSLMLFSDEVALINSIKNKVNIKDFGIENIYANSRDYYYKIENDEFEFQRVIDSVETSIKERLKNLSGQETYWFTTDVEFNEYNFDSSYFKFTPLKLSDYFTFHEIEQIYCSKCKTKSIVDLSLTNSNKFKNIYMDKDEANAFIKSRKNENGTIFRSVSIKIFFKLTPKVIEEKLKYGQRHVTIFGSIDYIEVYDSYVDLGEHGTGRLLYTMRKK